MGSRTGLDAEARREILCPCLEYNHASPVCSQTQYCVTSVHKYKAIRTKAQRMRNVKAKMTPLITGANKCISHNFKCV
jgi:hypothetical protein